MNVTPHFTYEELIASETAARLGIDNAPPSEVLPNLQRLADALERVRTLLGHSIHINSGYRCPELNKAVGGSKNSQHVQALAADLICPNFGTPLDVCKAIAESDVTFDQLIAEGQWTHFSIAEIAKESRGECLTAHFGTSTTYTTGFAV